MDEIVKIYNSYDETKDEIDFEFWNTEPLTYRIIVRDIAWGYEATAYFRGGDEERLTTLTARAYTEGGALSVLCDELEKRFAKE